MNDMIDIPCPHCEHVGALKLLRRSARGDKLGDDLTYLCAHCGKSVDTVETSDPQLIALLERRFKER